MSPRRWEEKVERKRKRKREKAMRVLSTLDCSSRGKMTGKKTQPRPLLFLFLFSLINQRQISLSLSFSLTHRFFKSGNAFKKANHGAGGGGKEGRKEE